MGIPVDVPLSLLANASFASDAMRDYVTPVVATLCGLAGLACTFFLVNGGIQYMTSSGNPEKLEHAKKIIKNALIGLVLVLAAATLTAILSNAYSGSGATPTEKFPTLQPIEPADDGTNFWDVLIKAVVGLLRNIVQSVGEPFLNALGFFLNRTPLMGDNASVFNLWLAVVGIADVLFILIVALIGFKVMSVSTFGLDEVEIKHLLPQIALIFLLVNTSIFLIDAIISLSNGMIHALQSGFPSTDVWGVLAQITKESTELGVAGLLVMVAFLVLSVMLLVYYVLRLVTLYIGAILSPLVLLLYLLPGFKDFAITALKTYLTTIFVLFVHVVILLLAASILGGVVDGDTSEQPNTLMALIVGLATVVALLKTQGVMQELSYAASAPRAAREMSSAFMKGVSYTMKTAKAPYKFATKAAKGAKKAQKIIHSIQQKTAQAKVVQNASSAGKKLGGMTPEYATAPVISSPPLKTGETRRASDLQDYPVSKPKNKEVTKK